MSQIAQQGELNRAALNVDDVYVIIRPPGPGIIQGIATNISGLIGTAHWGPVNAPVFTGSPQEDLANLGPITDEPYDLPTHLAAARSQGAQAFVSVRVTDGTDTAAAGDILDTVAAVLLTLPARYTGTFGNNLRIFTDDGAQPNTVKVTVQLNGTNLPKEIYNNIPAGTAADFQNGLIAALTFGQGRLRAPTELIDVTGIVTGAGINPPAITGPDPSDAYAFTGGTDGNTTILNATLIGNETIPTGIYLLENTGVFQFAIPGLSDATAWSPIVQFGLTRGMMPIFGFAANTTTTANISAKQTNGYDTYGGMWEQDYVLWDDPTNKVRRLIPPEAFSLGKIANLSPEQGVGNKPMFGFVGTTRSRDRLPYTLFEIARLETAGINFITNPIPYGNVFGMRHNQNGSSDRTIDGVNYTRMTNFLAQSFAGIGGKFIGLLQSSQPNDQLRADVRATFAAFLNKLKQPPALGGTGQIDDFALVVDMTNNTKQSIGEGFLNVEVAVRYLAVVRFFVVDFQGGQTVVVQSDQSNTGLTV